MLVLFLFIIENSKIHLSVEKYDWGSLARLLYLFKVMIEIIGTGLPQNEQ